MTIQATTQQQVEYIDQAQKRITADGRMLVKKTTLTTANLASVTLPADLVELKALLFGGTPAEPISTGDYLSFLTGDLSTATVTQSVIQYAIIGRTLYFWGTPVVDATIVYVYRSATIDSSSTFQVTGEWERLMERLVGANILLDDGQPELALAELEQYAIDTTRLRRRDISGSGRTSRIAIDRLGRRGGAGS